MPVGRVVCLARWERRRAVSPLRRCAVLLCCFRFAMGWRVALQIEPSLVSELATFAEIRVSCRGGFASG
eukprot:11172670-Lingulodinium_polyedra.AAC.1